MSATGDARLTASGNAIGANMDSDVTGDLKLHRHTASCKTFGETLPTRVTGRLQAFVFGQGLVESRLRGNDVTRSLRRRNGRSQGISSKGIDCVISYGIADRG